MKNSAPVRGLPKEMRMLDCQTGHSRSIMMVPWLLAAQPSGDQRALIGKRESNVLATLPALDRAKIDERASISQKHESSKAEAFWLKMELERLATSEEARVARSADVR